MLTVEKPKILDLFCGAGGAAMGYVRAGFDVIGVDIATQPNYPFKFVQDDAIGYALAYGWMFDAIHASPPCQHHSWSTGKMRNLGKEYPDFLPQAQFVLNALGLPFIIENVIGAPMANPIVLCGTQFGLRVFRHRQFESNVLLFARGGKCKHTTKIGFADRDFVTVAGHGADGSGRIENWQQAMGIDWMSKQELTQSIPPAFTEYLGKQLMRYVEARRETA